MKVLSTFDRNPISIGAKSTHTTVIGSVVGLLALIILVVIGITKIVDVLNRNTIYINYWRTEQTWEVYLDDIQLRLQIYGSLLPHAQVNNSLSLAVQKYKQKLIKLSQNKLEQAGLKVQLTTYELNFEDQDQKSYQMEVCVDEYKVQYLCVSKDAQMTLSQNCLLQYPRMQMKGAYINIVKVEQVFKQGVLREMLSDKGSGNGELLDAVVIVRLQFTDKSINPKLWDPRYSTPTIRTEFPAVILSNESRSYYHDMYFSSYNITTDYSILPSLFSPKKDHRVYWKHEKQFDSTGSIGYIGNQWNFKIQFNRHPISVVYERSYKKLDSVLAQILGISALIGLFIYSLFGHYAEWSSKKYLLSKTKNIKKDEQQVQQKQSEVQPSNQQPPSMYIVQLTNNLSCKKSKKEQQKKREARVEEIYKCSDLTQIYNQKKKVQQLELQFKTLATLLSKNEEFKRLYEKQLEAQMQSQVRRRVIQQEIEKKTKNGGERNSINSSIQQPLIT